MLSRRLDVRDAAAWDELLDVTVRRFGRLDTLTNVAGFLRPGYVHETEAATLALHIDVNVKGVVFGTRAAARHMVREGRGHIVNVASIAGVSQCRVCRPTARRSTPCEASRSPSRTSSRRTASPFPVFCPDAVETPMLTLQETYAEAAMTFGARRALSLDEVEDALHRVLRERPLELFVDVPLSGRALGARIRERVSEADDAGDAAHRPERARRSARAFDAPASIVNGV